MVYDICGFCWSIHYLCGIDSRFQANRNGNISVGHWTTVFFTDINPYKWNDVLIGQIDNAKQSKRLSIVYAEITISQSLNVSILMVLVRKLTEFSCFANNFSTRTFKKSQKGVSLCCVKSQKGV